MNVTRKDATITNTDEDFPGAFKVVLSTPSKDRDGEELAIEDWKTPLPDKITFDTDHGMSVAATVGSGVPTIEDGKLIVRGTYSSLPRAQEVRTLVKEGHIDRTSVAFMTEKVTKDGKTKSQRELLNGAFVAIPSNREAVVLGAKAGARNSTSDQAHIQAIYDHAVALGAAGPMDDTGAEEGAAGGKSYTVFVKGKYTAEQLRDMLAKGEALKDGNGDPSYPIGDLADLKKAVRAVGRGNADHDSIRAYIIRRAKALDASDQIPEDWNSDGSIATEKRFTRLVAAKAVDGSYEQREQAICDALAARYPGDDVWAYSIATFDDSVIYRVSGGTDLLRGQWQASYTYDGGTVTLGYPARVNLVEQVVPMKSYTTKALAETDENSGVLAQAVDAALDEAQNLIATVDATTLPEPVQQALGLITAAENSIDELLEALGVTDPDETEETTPPAEKSADADALEMKMRAIQLAALAG